MPSPQDDLLTYAQLAGLGTEAINFFSDVEPAEDAVDPAATFYGYGDAMGEYTQDQRLPAIERARVQVSARAVAYSAAEGLAEQLYDLFNQSNITIGGTYYTMIRPMSRPFKMLPDGNNRQQRVFNVMVRRRN